MIDIRDVLTLSNGNQYGVVSKATIDNIIYYYLVNINDNTDIEFCFEERTENKIELVEVNDEELIKKLLLSFADSIKNDF